MPSMHHMYLVTLLHFLSINLQQELGFQVPLTNQWSPTSVDGIAGSNPQSPSSTGAVEGSNPYLPVEDEPSGSSTFPPSSSDDNLSVSSSSGVGKCFLIPECWPPTVMHCVQLKSDEERKRALVPSVCNEMYES